MRLPNNTLAEREVLGAIMIRNEVLDEDLLELKPVHFFDKNNREVYKACLSLNKESIPIDIVSVSDRLKELGTLKDVGGRAFINDIAVSVITSGTVSHHADKVLKTYYLREILDISRVLEAKVEDSTNPREIISECSNMLFNVLNNTIEERMYLPDKYSIVSDTIIDKREHPKKFHSINTGFPDIDKITGGILKTDVVCVGASTSVGKTAFALNVAVNVALEGLPIVIFSLEMSAEQLMNRITAIILEIDLMSIKRGDVSKEELARIKREEKKIFKKLPITIYSCGAPDIAYLKAKIASEQRRLGQIGLVIVDHIHLMKGEGTRTVDKLSSITGGIKGLAMDFDLPVMMLAQLNRGDGKPTLSRLRESGTIEQDSNIVILLHRRDKESEDTEVMIDKNRDGPVGKVRLRLINNCTKFKSVGQFKL